MNQPPNGQWNQPSAPPLYGNPNSYGQPGGQAGGQLGAPPLYGNPGAPPPVYAAGNPIVELTSLKDDANLWLLVTAVGFWLGFGLITGPLGWYFGSRLRGRYLALGHHPCSAANWAWGLGIGTTLLSYLVALAVLAFFVVLFSGLAAASI